MTKKPLYLGVDIGGTKTAVSLWSENEQLLGKKRWKTPLDLESALERVVAESRTLLARIDCFQSVLAATGVSGGGPVDPERGVLLSVPNLPGWQDVPLCEVLSTSLGAPAHLENDANASALAEWLYGSGRGVANLVFLTCSTGIGAGLILDGRLYRGSRNLAGEAGHQIVVPGGDRCGCGQRGCLETYASGAGMARRLAALRENEPGLPASAREVTDLARRGDPFALDFLRRTASYLAQGIANLVYILNPQRVVLGTIAVGAGDLLLAPLREELERLTWPSFLEGLEVVPAALGDELGDRAALAVARRVSRPEPGR